MKQEITIITGITRLFAVDGSKINLPHALKKVGYRTPSDNAYYPQGLLSCLYQLKSQIPVDFALVSHSDERKVALTHLDVLSENDMVIYDRGYFSYEMLYSLTTAKIQAVFRLQRNMYHVIDEFIESKETEKVVTLTISKETQRKIFKKNPEIVYTPLYLRLIKYTYKETTYTLGTTLLDNQNYKACEFSDLYHSRWGIEELYKISKLLIDVEDFHGQTERGVKQELFAHFILITLSRIFSNEAEGDFKKQKEQEGENTNNFKANLKNCLITLARNLESLFLQQEKLIKKTINTIMSSIARCRQRQRPNRSYERRSRIPVKKWKPSNKKQKKSQNCSQTAVVV